MKAVILAGGKGTRLAPYTRVFPKPMMPIGDKTILEVLIAQMKRAGIDEIIITVGHLAGLMRAFFKDGRDYDLMIRYSYEDHPLGTAGPLSLIDGLDETFIVSNGDVLTLLDLAHLVAFHKNQEDPLATIATHHREVQIDLGVIESDTEDTVTGYIEKPTLEYLVSMGMYVFDPAILDYIPYNEYLDFPDLVLKLLADGKRVANYRYDGYYRDLGRPEDYDLACDDFEVMRSQFLVEG